MTTLLELTYSKDQEDKSDHSDLSEIQMGKSTSLSPTLIFDKDTNVRPQIPIIGIGGAGIQLLSQIVDRVQGYGMNYPTLAIDTDSNDLNLHENITHKFLIAGSGLGSAHQYRQAATRFKAVIEGAKEQVNIYLNDLNMLYKHEIVFLLLGSGGTGVGVGIELAKLLIEMGKRPVPFLILPTKEEMSRIKFNAAVALYYFNFAPKDRCLNLTTIVIDNEAFLINNSRKYYSQVIAACNERIAAVLGDLIATTELESHAYSADLNEFLEIFRDLKGIGLLHYLHVENPTKLIGETLDKNMDMSISLAADPYTATRAYLYLSTDTENIKSEDYRNLMLKFDNSDVFNKLYEIDSDDEFYAIRGIFTGIEYPERIRQLMQLAEDARVEILNREIDSQSQGKVNPKIDRLDSDEELDVKTGQELQEERAEEYAKMRREGGVS